MLSHLLADADDARWREGGPSRAPRYERRARLKRARSSGDGGDDDAGAGADGGDGGGDGAGDGAGDGGGDGAGDGNDDDAGEGEEGEEGEGGEERRLAALGCEWETAERCSLVGTADTPVEELGVLLDEMGVDHMELRVPGFVWSYDRSLYNNRLYLDYRQNSVTARSSGDGGDDDAGAGADGGDGAGDGAGDGGGDGNDDDAGEGEEGEEWDNLVAAVAAGADGGDGGGDGRE